MKKYMQKTLSYILPGILIIAGYAQASAVPDKAQEKSAESQAVQTQVEQASADKADSQRQKIAEEAVAAIE